MPISKACCCLCGGLVIDEDGQPSWMAQFYAVYAFDKKASALAWLSGPGHRQPFGDVIEAAPDGRPDDGNELPDIWLMRSSFGEPMVLSIPIDDPPQAWGFPFHSACWKTMSSCCPVEPSEMQALLSLCRSFPTCWGPLTWGHDYGGALRSDPVFAPGEEPVQYYPTAHAPDPYDIPELHQSFENPIQTPTPDTAGLSLPSASSNDDVFAKLPTEILSYLLIYLPSDDVCRLRRASRVYANVTLPDAFCKSRFFPGQEFQHVFEAERYFPSRQGQWKSIFRSVKAVSLFPAMVNRRRIWGLCHSLREMLDSMRDVVCDGYPVKSFFEPNAPSDGTEWVTASRVMKLPTQMMTMGSRTLYVRMLALPPRALAIFTSTIDLAGHRYISGLRILDKCGVSFSVGYRHPDTESLLLRANEPIRIAGFCLAQDQRGVRGIAVIDDTGTRSCWIGDHDHIPKRNLLPAPGSLFGIDHLKGGFDAVKLVSLAVPSAPETKVGPADNVKVRDTTLWYPDIPHKAFSFLGASGEYYRACAKQDLPLCYDVFGGISGECAPNLTKITVRTHTSYIGDRLLSIAASIGCEIAANVGLYEYKVGEEQDFIVDGPGGERISGIDTFHINGMLGGFKLFTNRDRSAEFPRNNLSQYLSSNSLEVRSVRADGETIVGFWVTIITVDGFSDIGLVAVATTMESGL
ncbi:hypothetical protein F4778DRAFT_783674 [Xylariomycetidae sp. FL2044]|nr:hypothetical protein F4778DRAFT_783674 [Xylariomycetidae sp. FL2044]